MSITYKDLVLINIFTGLNGVGKSELIDKIKEDVDSDNTILIYDKPENNKHNSLKVKWVNDMITNDIKKYQHTDNLIIFIETHDDHIINAIRNAIKDKRLNRYDVKVFNIELKQYITHELKWSESFIQQVEIIELDHNGTFSSNPKGFMDEWINQLYKLI